MGSRGVAAPGRQSSGKPPARRRAIGRVCRWLGESGARALLAELARRRGQTADAVTLATSALKDFERMGMADHPWTLNIRATLADALIALSRDDDALGVLTPALTSAPRVFVSYDARLSRLQAALARACR